MFVDKVFGREATSTFDIGTDNIEEVNIVRNGENYGRMRREGYFENGRVPGGALNQLFPVAPEILDGRGPRHQRRFRLPRPHRSPAR